MARCPNCDRSTARTQDLACQWCGYPLLNGSYKTLPQTFQELRGERPYFSELSAGAGEELAVPEVETVAEEFDEEAVSPSDVAEPEPVEAVEATVVDEPELATDEESITTAEIETETPPEAVADEPTAEAAAPSDIAETEVPETDTADVPPDVIELGPGPGAIQPETGHEEAPGEESPSGVIPDEEPLPEGVPEASTEANAESDADLLVMTVNDVDAACEAGSESARTWFAGRILELTGVVRRVATGELADVPCLVLTGDGEKVVRNVLCVFDKADGPELDRLTAGQQVTVRGHYDGCGINILVVDCSLAG